MLRIATVTLKSESPYSQSRWVQDLFPINENELPSEWEKRVWKERLHTTETGEVCIPPMALKMALSDAAAYRNEKIENKGSQTFTQKFKSSVSIAGELIPLGINKDDIKGEWIFCSSTGKKNVGARVSRCYPVIPNWEATVRFFLLDLVITDEMFIDYLRDAGRFIGIGRFRPKNDGLYGRFSIKSIQWETIE